MNVGEWLLEASKFMFVAASVAINNGRRGLQEKARYSGNSQMPSHFHEALRMR